MNISFGKKIPIAQTQVYNREINEFEKATVYEFDCKDQKDIDHIAYQHGAWFFKYAITVSMQIKNYKLHNWNSLSEFDKAAIESNRFYSIETDDGKEVIGLCETTGIKDFNNVQYLETNQRDKYKYSGQNLLATISKELIKKYSSPVLNISDPATEARDFYIKKCGFSTTQGRALTMEKDAMQGLIKNVEQRTQTKLIDLQG